MYNINKALIQDILMSQKRLNNLTGSLIVRTKVKKVRELKNEMNMPRMGKNHRSPMYIRLAIFLHIDDHKGRECNRMR